MADVVVAPAAEPLHLDVATTVSGTALRVP
jgi:hypothetical protein